MFGVEKVTTTTVVLITCERHIQRQLDAKSSASFRTPYRNSAKILDKATQVKLVYVEDKAGIYM